MTPQVNMLYFLDMMSYSIHSITLQLSIYQVLVTCILVLLVTNIRDFYCTRLSVIKCHPYYNHYCIKHIYLSCNFSYRVMIVSVLALFKPMVLQIELENQSMPFNFFKTVTKIIKHESFLYRGPLFSNGLSSQTTVSQAKILSN